MSFKSVAEFLDPTNGHRPTTAERKLITATKDGEACVLCDPDTEKYSLPAEATDETRIRASLLRLLITGGTKDYALHERGVTLFGGWIEGALDLAYCTARGQTALGHCHFTDKPVFTQAHLQNLNLQNSAFPGLAAQRARIKGNLLLKKITSRGTVNVRGAKIGGKFDCEKACVNGIIAENDTQLIAINAQGIETGQDLVLRKLIAMGTVAVNSARIGKALICDKAILDGGKEENGTQQRALHAQGVETGQSLSLTKVKATGTVDLNGANIGRHLGCRKLEITCAGKDAAGANQDALNAKRMTVGQGFYLQGETGIIGRINLIAAHVGDLVDERKSWPSGSQQVILDGFTYDRTSGPTTLAARRDWLETGSHWEGRFFPQPYTHLARVLRQMGHAGEARKVLIEREIRQGKSRRATRWKAARQHLPGFRSEFSAISANVLDWCADRLAFLVAGYGQDARRSLGWLLLLFVVAAALAHRTWEEGSFAPNSDVILASSGWTDVTGNDCFPIRAQGCDPNPAKTWSDTFTASAAAPTQGADWDSFNRYGYAADLVVPILDLGQTDAWAPSKDRGTWGWWLWWMRWVLATAGWIVTGLGVAAVTGVMQRNQPD
jgi:hypothetical protein